MRSKKSDLIASIDTGSNSIRLLIGFVDESGRVIRLHHERRITRLSDSLKDTGLLKRERMMDSLDAIKHFMYVSLRRGSKKILATGTHALREARNSIEFLRMVKDETGIDLRVITPEEEAQLTLEGVLSGFDDIRYPAIVFDMGGGSTEFVILRNSNEHIKISIPLGVVTLTEMMYEPHHGINGLRDLIRQNLMKSLERFRTPFLSLIGTGGTCTTLASIHLLLDSYDPQRIHGHRLNIEDVKDMERLILDMDVSQRRLIKGLEKGREDIIAGGAVFVREIMTFFNMKELTVSDYGILEGIIKKEAG